MVHCKYGDVMFYILEILFLLLLGFGVSIFANTLGIEGGIIFVPVFVFGLGLPMQDAAGTTLTTMIFGLGSGSLAYALQKRIDYKVGLLLGGMAIPGAILGAWVTQFISSRVLGMLFGFVLIPIAVRMIMRDEKFSGKVKKSEQSIWKRRLFDHNGEDFTYTVDYPFLGAGAYFFIGFLSGLLGIGGGVLRIPVLVLLLGVPIHIAIATSVFTMVISSVAGAAIHLDLGHVNIEYVIWLVPAVICGAQIGARVAKKTEAHILKKIFAFVLIIASIIIIAESFTL
jgi:uncharacterized membrane protein YfcA